MKLTNEKVGQIATLARLHLTEEEKSRYADQLSVILDYIEILNEVDTDGVEETCQVTGLHDVVREDVIQKSSEELRKKIIANFPEKSGDLLKVKAVFSSEE